MSLGDLLLPQLFRRLPPAFAMRPEAAPFRRIAAPARWKLRVDATGEPSTPTTGDAVEAWQPIGKLDGTPVLAPSATKVASVDFIRKRPDSTDGWLITLEPDEEGEKPTALPKLDDDAPVEQLLERLDTFGICEHGRSPRLLSTIVAPTAEDGPTPRAILLNAVDSEPLLLNASQMVREHLEELGPAADLLSRLGNGLKVCVAVSSSLVATAKKNLSDHDVIGVPDRYPENLDELVARRAFGDDGGPVAAVSLECALAALTAVQKGTPTLDRYLTVIAADGKDRRNVSVALGTPIAEVIDHMGFGIEDGDRVLSGGPFQGRAESLETATIDARTTAVMVLPESASKPLENDPCVRCGSCVEICPMALQPQELGRNAEFGLFDRNRALDVDACIGCGLCTYICPSGRPLLQWIELTWAELAAADALDTQEQ